MELRETRKRRRCSPARCFGPLRFRAKSLGTLAGLPLSLLLGCAVHVPRETVVEPPGAEFELEFIRSALSPAGIPVLSQKDARHGVSRFILDTGSEGTIISEKYAAQQGLVSRLTLPYTVIGSQDESRKAARVVWIEELRFETARKPGSLVFRRFDGLVAHTPLFNSGIEGILGAPLLDDRTFTIDFAANLLRIEDAPLDPSLPHTAPIRVSWGGLIYANVEVAGQSQWALLDTGDNGFLTVPEDRWDSLPLHDWIEEGRAEGFSFGGAASARFGQLDGSIVLAGQRIQDPYVTSGKGFAVGAGLLRDHALSIDKRSKLLRLVRSERKLTDRIGLPR